MNYRRDIRKRHANRWLSPAIDCLMIDHDWGQGSPVDLQRSEIFTTGIHTHYDLRSARFSNSAYVVGKSARLGVKGSQVKW